MPLSVKCVLILLPLSGLISAVGSYLDSIYLPRRPEYVSSYLYDIAWILVVFIGMWFLIFKKRNLQKSLILVGAVLAGLNASQYIQNFGGLGFYVHCLELIMFIVMYKLLGATESNDWFRPRNS